MSRQTGGGSVGQSIRYVDPQAPEQSASAGSDLLIERGLIARPAIGGGTRKRRKGGFYPSIMGGVVNSAMVSGPLAVFAARKLLDNRKGGGKKGNIWRAQKEEAKAILEGYGKPTAVNIQKFAVAKRRGSASSEQYLEEFRGRMRAKEEAAAAKREAKEAKKAEREAKKAAREAAKATKRAERAARKGTKATKKRAPKPKKEAEAAPVRKGTHLFFNDEGRVIESGTRKSPKPAAVAETVAKAVAAKTRKSPSNKSKTYFSELRKAREFLSSVGRPTGPNMSKFVSMKKKGINTAAWLENFKTRRPLATAAAAVAAPAPRSPPKSPAAAPRSPPKSPAAAPRSPPKSPAVAPRSPPRSPPKAKAPKTKKVKTAAGEAPAVKTRKSPSNKSKAYFSELRKAREFLSTVGRPTGPNMSKYVSMKTKGINTAAWLENFKTRRPLGVATVKAPRKSRATKKALTVVREENESNNNNNSSNTRSTSRSRNSNSNNNSKSEY